MKRIQYSLARFLEDGGITEYADWCHGVAVTPSGVPEYRPRRYQVTGLNHIAAYLPRMALYDDPGTGKTLQIQAALLWLISLGNKCVATMPPTLVPQFMESLETNFTHISGYVKIGAVHGDKPRREKQIQAFNENGWPQLLVVSYPTFVGRDYDPRALANFKRSCPGRITTKAWMRFQKEQEAQGDLYAYTPGCTITALNFKWSALKGLGYTFLACDEAHKLKNPDSDLHKAVEGFVEPDKGKDSEGLLLATGSPIPTNIEDAYGLIKLIDPTRYGSFRAFENVHCVLDAYTPFRKVVSYQNLDYLFQTMYAAGRRVTKKEAFPDNPERIIVEVNLTLSKAHKKLYDDLVNSKVLELEDRIIDATTQQSLYTLTQRMLLSPNQFSDTPILDNQMLSEISDILDAVGDLKVIVFAWYQDSVDTLREHLKAFQPAVINGRVTGKLREEAKKKFISDKKCRVLIANPQSGGVGLDGFQHVCSYVIFADICPHPGDFDQAVARVDRSGQTETPTVYLLVPKGTVAVKLRNDLCRKESNANKVIQDPKVLVAELLGQQRSEGVIK